MIFNFNPIKKNTKQTYLKIPVKSTAFLINMSAGTFSISFF